MVEGVLSGTAELQQAHAGSRGYVWTLSVVQLVAGAGAVGLVRPWSERIRGTAVPRWLPICVAGLGGCIVTALFTVSMPLSVLAGARPDQGLLHGEALVVMVLAYAPLILWGPLQLAGVAAFAARRTLPSIDPAATPTTTGGAGASPTSPLGRGHEATIRRRDSTRRRHRSGR